VLRRLFEYIALQEPVLSEHCRRITSIPCKKHQTLPEITYLEKNEMMAIVDAPNRRTALGRRDHAILLFMYNTGARVQEVADARASWLTLDPPPKTEILGKGRKWRTCPLWDSVAKVIMQVLDERRPPGSDDPHLFLNRYGRPVSRFGIWKIIEKYKKQAAVTTPSLRTKRVTPHTIRHTTAMHLLQSGVEINVIRSWLGHVNLATTHRYAEIDLAMKRKALESCELSVDGMPGGARRVAPDILAWLESL
jgi:site-specific recombinase XerD